MSALSEAEARWLAHMIRWGSDGYPIIKLQRPRGWVWAEAFGVKGAPVVYRTKREAVAACERYEQLLCDKKAGRLQS